MSDTNELKEKNATNPRITLKNVSGFHMWLFHNLLMAVVKGAMEAMVE